ncbi:MAG: YbaB/EbfC family nucleoid-associated protein [Segniliparus sp.]|uniref:YbaB/EbfC family nucleoid-associated protein n=1 Tax=Segniliparus sp. TaxID=2804064 RepID=UPI003F2B1B17
MKPLDSYSDPETWLADLKKEFSTLQEKGQQAKEALQQSHGTGVAANGEVTVVVGQGGQVQSLNLTDKALQLGPTKLSQAILTALRKAQNSAIDSAREAVSGLVGEEKSHELLDRYRLPDEDEEDSGPQAGAGAPAASDDDPEGRSSSAWVRKDDDHKRW